MGKKIDEFQRYYINERGKRQEVRLYKIWEMMKRRCINPKDKDYPRYGGRGIKLCKEWYASTNFMRWALSNGYKDTLTIDRIDTNGNYSPDNCRWTDTVTQSNNKRNTIYIDYQGEKVPLSILCKRFSIHRDTFLDRLDRDWSIDEALTIPAGVKRV